MLELRKKSLFSNEYVAEENGNVVAELSRSRWREQGEIKVHGRSLKLKKQGVLRDTFAVFDGDTVIVEVAQPSSLRSRLTFQFDGRDFEIRDKAWYSSTLLVKSGGSVVGSVRSRGLFFARTIVELPDSLPLALRVFIGWIAIVRWAEDEAAAAGAGGAC